jgi:hypothetical protein
MPARRTGIALLLTALAIGIVAFLPARIFESAANRALAPTARLQTAGTVWNGNGELQFTRGAGTLAIPLAWQFEPSWLARFRLGWRLRTTAPAASGSTSIGIGVNSLALRDTEFTTDAALWHRLSPAAMLLGAGGRLMLRITDGDVVVLHQGDQPRVEGNARIEAGNFALTTLAPQALGNYVLKLNALDGAVHFSFLPAQGALQFDGAGMLTLASPRALAFKGTASLSADLSPSMAASIRAAGTPQTDGRVLIDMKRNW